MYIDFSKTHWNHPNKEIAFFKIKYLKLTYGFKLPPNCLTDNRGNPKMLLVSWRTHICGVRIAAQ